MDITTDLYKGGRVTIPMPFRKELNMEGGDKVTFRLENDRLFVLTEKQLLEEARAALREELPKDYSAVDEFIAERRAEAAKETLEYYEHLKYTQPAEEPKA